MTQPRPLVELVVSEVPPAFVIALQQALPHIYKEAYQQAFSQPLWERSEGRYLFGHIRRALFEFQFRKAAIKAGLRTGLDRVPDGSYEYTYVRAGRLLLTGSALSSEDDLVRPAAFRTQHAQVNHFLSNPTLSIIDPPDIRDIDTIYGIVVHASFHDDKSVCSYGGIAIPNSDTTEWLEKVSLAEISKAQALAGFVAPESSEDTAFPHKKDQRRDKTKDE